MPPIPPADPWFAELAAAFGSDTGTAAQKAAWKAQLGAFYLAMQDHVSATDPAKVKTVGELLADYRAAQPKLLPDGALAAVRKKCGEKVAAVAPTDPDAPLDAKLRESFGNVFARLALCLDQVK